MTPYANSHSSRPEDQYIARVIEHIPPTNALQSQIAMDLRSHIAERLDAGQPIDEVVRQLGDPATLAESYLGAIPLVPATFGSRLIAKMIDALLTVGMSVAVGSVAAWLLWRANPEFAFFGLPVALMFWAFALPAYTIYAEYKTGQTVGKRLQGLRAVRESGARISLGQSFVRQLPWFLQIAIIDALFALFTEKNQRGFEIISKTRVVKQSD